MNRLALTCFVLLSLAIYPGRMPRVLEVSLLTAAWLAALAACWFSEWRRPLGDWVRWPLYAATAVSFVLMWNLGHAYLFDLPLPPLYFATTAAAAGLSATYLWPTFPRPNLRLAALLGAFLILGGSLIDANPRPRIDVWYFRQIGAGELLAGRNPYAIAYPNLYSEEEPYYGRGVLSTDGVQVVSNPYPPLSLAVGIPGLLVGDVRWASLGAMAGAGLLLVAVGRRLGAPAGHPTELIAVLFLFRPSNLKVLHLAWTEPELALMAGLVSLALASGSRLGVVLATAAFLATKQYAALCLPALWAAAPRHRRDLLYACLLAGLTFLPFTIWDFDALWRGVVLFQVRQPFREDSFSISAVVAAATGERLPAALGFGCAAAAAVLSVWKGARAPILFPLGGTAVLLGFFLFNKQAFLNYYWFVLYLGALAAVFATSPVNPPSPAAGSGRRP